MKILKLTTHWTAEEADCIYRFLDEFRCAIWENYGHDIELLYRAQHEEQLRRKTEGEREPSSIGGIPF